MLDSSPMPVYQPPPAPIKTRPLKRSASTASLPTPPRSSDKSKRLSLHKRRRGEETESDTGEEGDDHVPERLHGKLNFGVKPLNLRDGLTAVAVAREDPFSDGEPAKTPVATTTPLSPEKSPVRAKVARIPPLTPSPIRLTRAATKKLMLDMPIRDSPNNPFLEPLLVTPKKKRTSKLKGASTSAKIPYEEQPTLTYVFRGQKTEFVNPHYKLSKDALLASQLPVEHVDYEASETLKPMQLFKAEIGKKSMSPGLEEVGDGLEPKTPVRPKKTKTQVHGGWSSSEDEATPLRKSPRRQTARRG